MDSKIFITFVLGPKSLIRDGQIIFFCKTGLYLKLGGESFNFTFNRILRFIYTSDKKTQMRFYFITAVIMDRLHWRYLARYRRRYRALFTYLGCRVAQGGQGKLNTCRFRRCGDSPSTDNSSTDFSSTDNWSTAKLIDPTYRLIDHLV